MALDDWSEEFAKERERWIVPGRPVSVVHVQGRELVNATVVAYEDGRATVQLTEGDHAGKRISVAPELLDDPFTAESVPEAVARMRADVASFLADVQRHPVERYFFESEEVTFEEVLQRLVKFSAEAFLMRWTFRGATLTLHAIDR